MHYVEHGLTQRHLGSLQTSSVPDDLALATAVLMNTMSKTEAAHRVGGCEQGADINLDCSGQAGVLV